MAPAASAQVASTNACPTLSLANPNPGDTLTAGGADGNPNAFSVEVQIPNLGRGVDFAAYAIGANGQEQVVTFPVFVGQPPMNNAGAATPTPVREGGGWGVGESIRLHPMAPLDFAFWDVLPHTSTGTAIADDYDSHIRLVQHLEDLGWHSYFVIEHQNAPQGVSAPSVYLTAVARETSKMRLGAMMWQLPFYQPIRLAQDVAMLDQLSRGRVEFGTGIGVHEHEFIRWGVDYYQRAAISEEVLKIVKMAWTQDEVTFSGKYFHFDEALPHPKPYQQPYPPIWAAVHSDTSVEFAARNNYHVAKNLDTDEVVAGKFSLYRRIWKESGHAGPMPRMFLMRTVHVARTDEQAHAEAREYVAAGAERVGGGPIAQTRIGWGSNSRGMGADSERADNKARGQTMAQAARDYQFNIDNGLAIVGSPETVIRRLREGQERMGYDVFCTNHQIGRMPRDLVDRSIELFGKEVIPAFQSVAMPAQVR